MNPKSKSAEKSIEQPTALNLILTQLSWDDPWLTGIRIFGNFLILNTKNLPLVTWVENSFYPGSTRRFFNVSLVKPGVITTNNKRKTLARINKSNLVSDYLHWYLTFADLFGRVTIFASQFVFKNLRHWWIWIYFAFSISSEGFRPDLRNNGHGKHWASSGGAKYHIHLYKDIYTNTRRTCVYRQPWISDALGRPLKCFLHSSLKLTAATVSFVLEGCISRQVTGADCGD